MRDEARERGGRRSGDCEGRWGRGWVGRGIGEVLLGCAMLGAVGGCVRPAAVGRYARAAGKTAAEFPALAADMQASCLRFEGYRESRAGAGWFDRGDLEPRCARRAKAVRRTVAVERVLAGYFTALAGLTDDRVVSYDRSIGQLAGSLEDDAGLDPEQVRAVADLAAFAASVATDGYRRSKLTNVIEQQNANVTVVIDALTRIVGTDYASILDVEEAGMEAFYRSALAEGAEGEPLAAILVRDTRDARAEELREKRSALAAYVKALAAMKAGHQRLYEGRRDLDARALARELAGYAAQLEELLPALRDAF